MTLKEEAKKISIGQKRLEITEEDFELVMGWVNGEVKLVQVGKIKNMIVGARLYIYLALVLKEMVNRNLIK